MAPTFSPTHLPTPHSDVCRTVMEVRMNANGRPVRYPLTMCQGFACNTSFPAITNIADCSRAGTILGTPDTFASFTNNSALPAGCYFKTSNFYNTAIGHHNTSLWFNPGGNRSLADPVRLSLCGVLPPLSSAPTQQPTNQPTPSLAPTPAYCVDQPPTRTGYRLRYRNGTSHPASCADLLRVNACTHSNLGTGVRRVCCLTCLGHPVSDLPDFVTGYYSLFATTLT